jgi:hypothetical protein
VALRSAGPRRAARNRRHRRVRTVNDWLSAIPPQGGFLFIPASFFSFCPFLQSIPIHFNRGRDRLVLNPALGKNHLSLAIGLPPRAALCALGLFFQRCGNLARRPQSLVELKWPDGAKLDRWSVRVSRVD